MSSDQGVSRVVERPIHPPRIEAVLAVHRRAGWRRWLVLAGAIALGIAAWAGWNWYSGREARAARRIVAQGGQVRWSDDRQPQMHILSISLAGPAVDDAVLKELAPWHWRFPALQDLDLSGSRVTDAGLAHLHGLDLRNLVLDGTKVSNAGLEQLASFKNLRSLALNRTQITDDGLRRLAQFPSLTAVYLQQTAVTDGGLEHLARLESLRYVRLGENAGVTDQGVRFLQELLPHVNVIR
jgi:hypothetical protein